MTCLRLLPLVFATACSTNIGVGCSTKPPAPKPTVGEAKTVKPNASREPPTLQDGLIGDPIRRVQYRRIILSKLTDGARILEPVEFAHEPDDRDDSFLACRPVDVSSVPNGIRDAVSKPWSLFLDDGTRCTERLKDLEACGWLLPKPKTSRMNPRAKKVFTDGAKFIAGKIVGDGCHFARWASVEDVKFWSANAAPDALKARAIDATRQLPESIARQGEFERFKQLVRATETQGTTASARPPLPESWFDLGGDTASWLVAPSADQQLIITYFKRRPAYNQLPASLVQASIPSGFCATLVSVSSIDRESQVLTRVPAEMPVPDCEDFQIVGAATNRPGLPMLLFEKTGTAGALRFSGSRYVVDGALTSGPGG
jgi:hypothetical protein